MNDEGSEVPVEKPAAPLPGNRRWLIPAALIAILAAFLAGFIPMWLHSRGYESQLESARVRLVAAQMESQAAGAAIDARLGKYEEGRQGASAFFHSLQSLLAHPDGHLSAAQREQLAPLLEQRDEVITVLARGDPASAERLTQLYLAARAALSAS